MVTGTVLAEETVGIAAARRVLTAITEGTLTPQLRWTRQGQKGTDFWLQKPARAGYWLPENGRREGERYEPGCPASAVMSAAVRGKVDDVLAGEAAEHQGGGRRRRRPRPVR